MNHPFALDGLRIAVTGAGGGTQVTTGIAGAARHFQMGVDGVDDLGVAAIEGQSSCSGRLPVGVDPPQRVGALGKQVEGHLELVTVDGVVHK